ncbi:glycosyltransferase [Edwardsiella tarda]|uniref:glycosyltransferase n=1 Tax=Edwardsiella tarda TaxID=636 RepID=UPI00351CAB6D
MLDLSIAISTISSRICNLKLEPYPGVQYVIVHQEPNTISDDFLQSIKKRHDIIYVPLEKRGLSLSRNTGLAISSRKYVMIMDDDVTFSFDSISELIENMERDNVDVATYYHKYADGRSTLNTRKVYDHNKINIAKPSSIDICIKRNSLLTFNLSFDESFGLGAKYPSGEEMILLADCLSHKLLIRRYPIEVCTHPPITSGMDFYSSLDKTIAKYAMFKRVYQQIGPLMFFAFVIKKTPQAYKSGKLLSFLKNSLISVARL